MGPGAWAVRFLREYEYIGGNGYAQGVEAGCFGRAVLRRAVAQVFSGNRLLENRGHSARECQSGLCSGDCQTVGRQLLSGRMGRLIVAGSGIPGKGRKPL